MSPSNRTINWEELWDRKLLELRHPQETEQGHLKFTGGTPFSEIARRMNNWFDTDVFTKDNTQKRYALLTPPPLLDPVANPTPHFSVYFDAFGKLRAPAPPKNDLEAYVRKLEESGRCYKTLVISDTQGTFCREDILTKILEDNPYTDLIVLPGDVVDWDGVSRFVHTRDIPLVHECDWYVRLLQGLTTRYPGVPIVITDSNHRRRVANSVRQLPSSLLFLVDANPEAYLAQPFPDVHAITPWWWQCGDAIYSHTEGKTAEAGDNAKAAIDAFILKLLNGRVKPFRVVYTGHSHKLGAVIYKTIKGIDTGCVADLDYTTVASALKTVQEKGYAVCVQRAGRADLNQCREFSLGRD